MTLQSVVTTGLAGGLRVTVAVVLAIGALEKLRAAEPFLDVLHRLGLARTSWSAYLWWAAICVTELGTAVVVIAGPSSSAAAMLLLLAGAFGWAGWAAVRSHSVIQCACFGSARNRPLGRSQLIALPIWFLAAVGITVWPLHDSRQIMAVAAAAILLLLAVPAWSLFRIMRSARTDRLATSGGATMARVLQLNEPVQPIAPERI